MKINVWKCDKNLESIFGTDRILVGPSKRWVMKHVASEEGDNVLSVGVGIVRLKNGESWVGSII